MREPSEAARAAAEKFAEEMVGPPPKEWFGMLIPQIRDDVAKRVLEAIDSATADLLAENAELKAELERLRGELESVNVTLEDEEAAHQDTLQIVQRLKERLTKAAAIIETGDQRLLASDGPAGGQPPDLTLAEWKRLYELVKGGES